MVRPEVHGLPIAGHGLLEPSLLAEGVPQVDMGADVVGPESQGLLELARGLGELALTHQGGAQAVIGLGIIRGLKAWRRPAASCPRPPPVSP